MNKFSSFKTLTAALLALAFIPFAAALIWIQPARFTIAAGSPAWSYSVAPGSTDGANTTPLDNSYNSGAKVTAGQSGNVTKVGFKGEWGFGATIKMAVYNLAGDTLLGSGSRTISADPGGAAFNEITIDTPFAVTASTVYRVSITLNNNGAMNIHRLSGQASGSGYVAAPAYASFPGSALSSISDTTDQNCVGLYITP